MASSFIAHSISRGIDSHIDRLWMNSIGEIMGDTSSPKDKSLIHLIMYTIFLTIIAYLIKLIIDTILNLLAG